MKTFLIFVTGLLMFTVFGCSDSEVTAPSSNEPASTPVLPAKAAEMVTLYGATEDGTLSLTMPQAARSELDLYLTDSSYDVYAVTTFWGSLNASGTNPPTAPAIDWSGSMSVNGVGAMGIAAVLSFEIGEDSLLPTNDPMGVAWRSATMNDIDGLVTFIAMKREIAYITAPSLFVKTTPVSFEIVVGSLERYQAFYPTGDLSGLAIFARKLKPLHCPRGQFSGDWTRADDTHMNGTFSGNWQSAGTTSASALETGTMQGNFWTGDAQSLFEGDWFDSGGSLVGKIKGVWAYTDYAMCPVCGTRFGMFEGDILDLSGHVIGSLQGGFGEVTVATPTPPPLALSMVGQFKFNCPSTSDVDIADN